MTYKQKTNILQQKTQNDSYYCPQELVIRSTIHKHIVKDTSDNMLSVLLSATMTNTSVLSHRQRTFPLFIHLYVKPAIYFHLLGWCVRDGNKEKRKKRVTKKNIII